MRRKTEGFLAVLEMNTECEGVYVCVLATEKVQASAIYRDTDEDESR